VKSKKILEELNSTWNPSQYPAASVAPRKDFVPFNKSDQPAYGKQRGADFPNSSPVPPNPASMPHPLETVVDDLADSFVYLQTSLKKISTCCKFNPSLKKKQKQKLMVLYKYGTNALKVIAKIGANIQDAANMAGQPTPDASVPQAQKAIKRN
jgi:hypothetical protein